MNIELLLQPVPTDHRFLRRHYYKSGAVDAHQYHRIGNAAATTGQRGRVAHTFMQRKGGNRDVFVGFTVFSVSTGRVDLATLRHSSGIDSAPQPQPHASLAPWCQTKLAVQRFLRSDAQAAGDGVAYTSEITCDIIAFRPKKIFSNSFLDLRASIFVINHARV